MDEPAAKLAKSDPGSYRAVLYTALIDASKRGDIKSAEAILAKDQHICSRLRKDANNKVQRTPLMHAVDNGHIDMTRWLCGHNADVNEQSKTYGKTALTYAVKNGNLGLYICLDTFGAQKSCVDNDGRTLLHIATMYKQYGMMPMLLTEEEIDINHRTNSGETALVMAARNGDVHAMFMLHLQGADITIPSNDGNTALHMAARSCPENVVEYLIGLGLDVDATNENGYTPLHEAAAHNRQSAMDVLLKHHANENAVSNGGRSVCHTYARTRVPYETWTQGFRMLVEYGALIDGPPLARITPLTVLVEQLEFDKAVYVLDLGANIDAIDSSGYCALSHAVVSFHFKRSVPFLLKHGASLCPPGCPPENLPVNLAARQGNLEPMAMLVEVGAIPPTSVDLDERFEYHSRTTSLRALVASTRKRRFAVLSSALWYYEPGLIDMSAMCCLFDHLVV